MQPGHKHSLCIEKLDDSAVGVGTLEGYEVRVPHVFPGERVQIRIDHVARHGRKLFATATAIDVAHPQRRTAPCPSHSENPGGTCCGCPLMTLHPPAQAAMKRRWLAEAHELVVDDLIDVQGGNDGYRWSSKRIVSGRPGALVLGSYVKGTHKVADMLACAVDHPALVACLDELRREANALRIEPYDETTRSGDLRYLWLKTDGAKVLLTLLTASRDSRAALELPAKLKRPAGLWWSVQEEAGNSLRGAHPRHLAGDETLAVDLCGSTMQVGPLGFLQPNPRGIERAYADLVCDLAGERLSGTRAFDLYAGAGVTTELLKQRFQHVHPCELYPESAAALGVPPLRAEIFLGARPPGEPVDLVVANPPRSGLGTATCEALAAIAPRRIHIMSCHAKSLARDLAMLEASGYHRVGARAYDTLPQTAHVEVVAWLQLASMR
ncbi:MAG: hypothetical protein V3V08_18240 [Nannocystaceae bacterium]